MTLSEDERSPYEKITWKVIRQRQGPYFTESLTNQQLLSKIPPFVDVQADTELTASAAVILGFFNRIKQLKGLMKKTHYWSINHHVLG